MKSFYMEEALDIGIQLKGKDQEKRPFSYELCLDNNGCYFIVPVVEKAGVYVKLYTPEDVIRGHFGDKEAIEKIDKVNAQLAEQYNRPEVMTHEWQTFALDKALPVFQKEMAKSRPGLQLPREQKLNSIEFLNDEAEYENYFYPQDSSQGTSAAASDRAYGDDN